MAFIGDTKSIQKLVCTKRGILLTPAKKYAMMQMKERRNDMSHWNRYKSYRNYYDDEGNDLRGGNDEYYVAECDWCGKRTEHDVCTDKCVNCK